MRATGATWSSWNSLETATRKVIPNIHKSRSVEPETSNNHCIVTSFICCLKSFQTYYTCLSISGVCCPPEFVSIYFSFLSSWPKSV